MSLNRYDAKRDLNEKEIVRVLKQMGVSVERLDRPCDLLLGRHGITRIAEIKGVKAGLNKSQRKFEQEWRGSPLIILRTIDDAIKCVEQDFRSQS